MLQTSWLLIYGEHRPARSVAIEWNLGVEVSRLHQLHFDNTIFVDFRSIADNQRCDYTFGNL